ncbi:MAG: GPP34 family phosphoprotein [Bacteroidales bacterium]|nr:GPP34 family phosphoprotein [Candidatus Latescibacterota bacterium]
MISKNSLFLHEEIMLLALRDKEGTTAGGTKYKYAIGGAILAELLLDGRIAVEKSKKKLVNLVSSKQVGEPVIDECLARIANTKRRASMKTWVTRFAGLKKLNHRVAEQLCSRGILQADEDKVLLIFTRKIYPQVNPQPERQLIERLRKAIFTEATSLDPRTIVLVSLANGSDLLKLTFNKKQLKGRKKRIEKIQNGEMAGKATKEAIEAAEAAAMVVIMITTCS